MGKYAATRGIQGNKKWREAANSAGNGMFGKSTDEASYALGAFLYNADRTGIYRGYIDARDSLNYMRDYLKNRGLSWSDIKYPSMTYGYTGLAAMGRATLSISKNIDLLYG